MDQHADGNIHREYIEAFIRDDQKRMTNLQTEGGSHKNQFKLRSDPRITRIGKFLRKTSIDELPQLWNVLQGDMSLVGPRPPIPYEVELYESWHAQRLAVKPGLTGLWQVTARSSVTFDEMAQLDIEYIQRKSFWFDLVIILKTPFIILSGKGAE
jgi:lipopolysaccharide/colanic/teichoic acid biosynthesis glycosyltransferase